MQLNYRQVSAKAGPVEVVSSFDMSDLLKDRQDVSGFGLVQAQLTADHKSGLLEIEGTLRLPIELVCSRCLGSAKEELEIPFQESFTPKPELVPDDDRDDVHLIKDEIDLKPYVEEAVWLALPYIPLCKEDCLGLCPVCGQNRNIQECGCNRDRVDPRLAGLADFFNDSNK
jgi:uncharacterized protein